MNIDQVQELLNRYQSGKTTPAEEKLIQRWYQQLIATSELNWAEGEKEMMKQFLEDRLLKKLYDAPGSAHSKLFSFAKRWWLAASVIFLLLGFSYIILLRSGAKNREIASKSIKGINAPQASRAMITLANGQRICLDSVASGSLAVQGDVQLLKLPSGELMYQQSGTDITTVENVPMNTLTNPRGSKVVHMVLSDGSKVWLNAGSSLTYPVAFVGKERLVHITGESYFEVSHNASRPFIVQNQSVFIRVLGTRFNVNTFKDENQDLKVTLLEGSVKIKKGNASGVLQPGQQALVSAGIKIKKNVDLALVMAWKNGFFQFDNASLQDVMQQISRWYDVHVVYEGYNRPRAFMGEIQRGLDLAGVLRILEKNQVHFKVDGKNVLVLAD